MPRNPGFTTDQQGKVRCAELLVTQTAPPKESVLLANEGHFISGDLLKRLAPDFDGGHPMGKSSNKMKTLPLACSG